MSRLIDADALIAQMEADAEQMEEPIAKMFAYAAISDIKHAPTIEPQRKKGKWIPTKRGERGYSKPGFRCDQCKDVNLRTNYCPSCGAEMEVS